MRRQVLIIGTSLLLGAVSSAAILLNIDNARKAVWNYLASHNFAPVVVVLGDSHVARNDEWAGTLNIKPWQVINAGVDGYQAQQVYTKYKDQLAGVDHCMVVIMAGINRVRAFPVSATASSTANAIDQLISLVLHRGKTAVLFEVMYTSNANDQAYVRILNNKLKQIADNNGVKFVTTNSKISEDGLIRNSLSSDGLHLNSAGYSVLADTLQAQALSEITATIEKCGS